MDKAKREHLMNICLFSLVLSVLYGIMITGIDNSLVSETSYISGPGGFVVFVLFFLILYPLHILLSMLQFAVIRLAGESLVKRLVISNATGLVVVGAIYYITQEIEALWLIFSLAVFSAVALIRK
ncbi:hypothetical protein MKZ24_23465 [Paenibacillus sp. FSL R7-0297]|uniref:hypothetical protein n=1 Tax=Paenibacillus sp. FSL R7-0297 TaxID=2921680 RepID=UPI0030F581CA